jgi:hypothetical protein
VDKCGVRRLARYQYMKGVDKDVTIDVNEAGVERTLMTVGSHMTIFRIGTI